MNLIGWHNVEKSSKPLEHNMQVLVGQALQSKTQLFQKEKKFYILILYLKRLLQVFFQVDYYSL